MGGGVYISTNAGRYCRCGNEILWKFSPGASVLSRSSAEHDDGGEGDGIEEKRDATY